MCGIHYEVSYEVSYEVAMRSVQAAAARGSTAHATERGAAAAARGSTAHATERGAAVMAGWQDAITARRHILWLPTEEVAEYLVEGSVHTRGCQDPEDPRVLNGERVGHEGCS